MSTRPLRVRKATQHYVPETTEFVIEPSSRKRQSVRPDDSDDEENDDETTTGVGEDESEGVSSEAGGAEESEENEQESGGEDEDDDDGISESSETFTFDPNLPPISLHWSRATPVCYARDKNGDWYPAKLVDVIKKDDPRLNVLTPEVSIAKRGLRARANRTAEFDVEEGDWVCVHFQGWSSSHDEWILFTKGGFLCTEPLGNCYCRRHRNGFHAERARGKQAEKLMSQEKSREPKKSSNVKKASAPSAISLNRPASSTSTNSATSRRPAGVNSDKNEKQSLPESVASPLSVQTHAHRTRFSTRRYQNGDHGDSALHGNVDETSTADTPTGKEFLLAAKTNDGDAETKKEPGEDSTEPPPDGEPLDLNSNKNDGMASAASELAASDNSVASPLASLSGLVIPRALAQNSADALTPEATEDNQEKTQETKEDETTVTGTNTADSTEDNGSNIEGVGVVTANLQSDNVANTLHQSLITPKSDAKSKKKKGISSAAVDPNSERVETLPNRILELDDEGIPLASKPIMAHVTSSGISVERLLKTADVGTYNTACRWWFKGEKLTRPAVMQGAAVLVEWWEATNENRPRRNVFVNVEAATAYLREMDAKRGITPEKAEMMRKMKRMKSEIEAPPTIIHEGTGVSLRRTNAIATDGNPYVVKLLAASGRWEVSLAVGPNQAYQRIGLFDSNEEASSAAKRAYAAVEQKSKIMREQAALSDRDDFCRACGKPVEVPETNTYSSCSFCPFRFHINCTSQNGSAGSDSTSPEWMCPNCEYELLMLAVRVGGSTSSTVIYQKPRFASDSAGSGQKGAGHGSSLAIGSALKGSSDVSKLRRGTTSAGRVARAGHVRFEDEIRYKPQEDGETEWNGVAFLTPPYRIAERKAFFTSFSRLDRPGTVFRVLDHVIIGRRGSALAEDVEEEQRNSPDFFVAQIEALWEDRATGDRFMRIAWFFWPEETDSMVETFKDVGEGWALLTSSEVEDEPITRVIAKTRVLTRAEFDKWKAEKENKESATLATPATPPPATEELSTAKQAEDSTSNQSHLRECPRCGMWGFRDTTELGAHSLHFCGIDTPEALQNRRAEWGAPVATGEEMPRPATKQVELKPKNMATTSVSPRSNSKASQRASSEMPSKEDNAINPLVVSRALARAEQGPFFAESHYNQRESKVEKFEDCALAMNAVQSSLLGATFEQPQTSYWAEQATSAAKVSCADDIVIPEQAGPQTCAYCGSRFASTDISVVCCECEGVALCVKCVEYGRQGICGLAQSTEPQIHHLAHKYRVRTARAKPTNISDAMDLLEKFCSARGLGQPQYELLEVLRAPSIGEPNLRRPRFRFGVNIPRLPAAICAEEYGFTVEQAKAQAAFSALRTYFGASHALDAPLFKGWSCWEAAKLIDGMRQYGLAWETVAPIVGSKDPADCRLFFSDFLVPFSNLSNETEESVPSLRRTKVLIKDGDGVADSADVQSMPVQLLMQVEKDAKEWAEKVLQWRRRRGEGRPGTAFAYVEGLVVRLDGAQWPATNSAVCQHCRSSVLLQERVTCVVCSDVYHTNCATTLDSTAASTAKDDWYCPKCLADEKFVYEHACWGASGRLLCAIAEKSLGHHVVEAWDHSNKILAEQSRKGYEVWTDQHQKDGGLSSKRASADLFATTAYGDASGSARKKRPSESGKRSGKRSKKALFDTYGSPGSTVSDTTAAIIASLKDEIRSLKAQLDTVMKERDFLLTRVVNLTSALEEAQKAAKEAQTIDGNN